MNLATWIATEGGAAQTPVSYATIGYHYMLADITMAIYAFLLNSAIVSTVSRIPRTIWGPVDAQNPPANPIPPPLARRRAELNTTLPKPFGPLPLGKRQVTRSFRSISTTTSGHPPMLKVP